jgi:predicted RNA binding protein YcfA (HicA-like mRNA interferase family)
MMKRAELLKRLAKAAKASGVEMEVVEGGSHTKVRMGDRQTVVPRHSEINELTARAILRQMGVVK